LFALQRYNKNSLLANKISIFIDKSQSQQFVDKKNLTRTISTTTIYFLIYIILNIYTTCRLFAAKAWNFADKAKCTYTIQL